ncbi:hypothetical protein LEMLEM_LOCUS14016 [Lemmus lemmus]
MPLLPGPRGQHCANCISSFPTEVQEPLQVAETREAVVCALGLVVGLVGAVIGSVFIVRALHSGHDPRIQGPL